VKVGSEMKGISGAKTLPVKASYIYFTVFLGQFLIFFLVGFGYLGYSIEQEDQNSETAFNVVFSLCCLEMILLLASGVYLNVKLFRIFPSAIVQQAGIKAQKEIFRVILFSFFFSSIRRKEVQTFAKKKKDQN